MNKIQLGNSDLRVTPICLGTMTFGQQVDEPTSHRILSRAVERGVNFLDTAEMYPVPPTGERYGWTETYIGNWLEKNPGMRQRVVLATKAAGPVRGYEWLRNGSPNVTAQDIVDSCEASLRRLKTDHIELYQLHWPVRNLPMFGAIYFDPARDKAVSTIHEQLEGFQRLVRDGKVGAIGLSNETPYGVHEFVRIAEQHGLPRIATVQNPYCLVNRSLENGLDETMHRLGVSLLAYSPLGFGLLTGKYDEGGLRAPGQPRGRLSIYETMQKQRWGRDEGLAAARRYNALAREHGLTPTRMALAFCYTKWQVASTIIGVTSLEQLDEDLDAWGTTLSPELLAAIDKIRWEDRDPSQ